MVPTAALLVSALALLPQPRELSVLDGVCTNGTVVEKTDSSVPAEGYRLEIGPAGAVVTASDGAGFFYARQTLAQLKEDDSWPCVKISDAPKFPWRGVLLDDSRHFFGKDAVKRTIDLMASFKMNVLHWHLTDDQGWRVQIDAYPELTRVGATRPAPDYSVWIRDLKPGTYGPFFYTKADIREIVSYAAARHVRVIPEVDFPGHSRAVMSAYPELFCFGADEFLRTMRDPKQERAAAALCLGNEKVIPMYERIFDELVELFPDPVVHIGGDECTRTNWVRCAKCRRRMETLGLKDAGQLQENLTRHFADYLARKGKRVCGWQEMMTSGLRKDAQIQSWLGAEAGVKAAQEGRDVVMSPHMFCYFDYPQGSVGPEPCAYVSFGLRLDLAKAYSFDPLKGIPAEHVRHILGSESANWAEQTRTEAELQWKMWPRTLALSEILWTYPEKRDYAAFEARVRLVSEKLRAKGVAVAETEASVAEKALDNLLPVPRRIERRTGTVPKAASHVKALRGEVPGAPADVGAEAYVLDVAPEGVTITASDPRGERYARVTLKQLQDLCGDRLPNCRITDWPALRWRGYMNDCGRNYLDFNAVKAIVDTMAKYKMNLFHWHLSDYHGWRLESRRYPQLQRKEAFLRQVGRFYTQDEFRELVAYATERGVTVMPELDVPGHTLALRKGLDIDSMSAPGTDKVVADLFEELCSLAPADVMPFVHLGTDEVRTKAERCDDAWVSAWARKVNALGRKAVVWAPGKRLDGDIDAIDMAWYDNHITNSVNPVFDAARMYHASWNPFMVAPRTLFTRPCRWTAASGRQIGAIACSWHDDAVGDDTLRLFRDSMVFPAIVSFAANYWSGCASDRPDLWQKLPAAGTAEHEALSAFERKLAAHRDRFFDGFAYPFPFVRQTDMRWRLTLDGEVVAENAAQAWFDLSAGEEGAGFTTKTNGEAVAEAWFESPVEQTVGAWIDFTCYGSAYQRLDDPSTPDLGEWNKLGARISLNGEEIPPPAWRQPNMKSHTPCICEQDVPWSTDLLEKPFQDEGCVRREPTPIRLKKGVNHVRLVFPKKGAGKSKWIALFAPVAGTSSHPREVSGLHWLDPTKGMTR